MARLRAVFIDTYDVRLLDPETGAAEIVTLKAIARVKVTTLTTLGLTPATPEELRGQVITNQRNGDTAFSLEGSRGAKSFKLVLADTLPSGRNKTLAINVPNAYPLKKFKQWVETTPFEDGIEVIGILTPKGKYYPIGTAA